jgi:hypothetical protein
MVNIIFIINDKKSCLDLFPRSEKISDIEEAKFYVVSSLIYLLILLFEEKKQFRYMANGLSDMDYFGISCILFYWRSLVQK